MQWLRQDLAASNDRCTLAYWHHPLFSSGNYTPGIASVRPLFQALYDYDADVLLTGHDHNYERFARQDPNGTLDQARGIREFIVGTGGHSQYPQTTPIANSEVRNSGSLRRPETDAASDRLRVAIHVRATADVHRLGKRYV